jgi:two-component system, sensor histidine kinase LadS
MNHLRKRCTCWRTLAFACWLLLATSVHAAAPALPLSAATARASLGAHAELLIDEGGNLSIQDVAAPERAAQFTLIDNINRSYGYSRTPHWVRFTLQQDDAKAREWLLEVVHAYLDDVQLYTSDATAPGGWRMRRTGDRVPFIWRDVDYHNFVFRVPLEGSQARTFYLRLQTEGNLSFPLQIWSPHHFAEAKAEEQALLGAYYGIIVTIILYNLFLYFSFREKVYLFYVVHAAVLALFLFTTNGLAYQYLWPNSPWFGNYAHLLLSCGAVLAGGIFFWMFLRLRDRFPLLDLLFRAAVVPPAVLMVAAIWLRYDIASRAIMAVTLVDLVFWLGAGVWLVYKRFRPARLFVLVFFVEIVGAGFTVLNRIGLLSTSLLTEHMLQIGSVIEMVLFSMALATRINTLRRENEQVQAAWLKNQEDALQEAKRSESALEQRVTERTIALWRANQQLEQEIGVRRQAEELLRESEQKMRHMAHHDSLTELPNRTLVVDRLDKALAHGKRHAERIAVMMIDLDHFKAVNDTLGHPTGDRLLIEVGMRLQQCIRETDSVGRMSGDEFVVVLAGLPDDNDATAIAEKIIQSLAEPVIIDGHALRVGCSLGLAIHPDDGADSYTLLKNADIAMYRAKIAGRNRYASFTPA